MEGRIDGLPGEFAPPSEDGVSTDRTTHEQPTLGPESVTTNGAQLLDYTQLGFAAAQIAWETSVHQYVSRHELSRISATNDLLPYTCVPIGQLLVAAAAAVLGPATLTLYAGIGCAVTALAPLLSPSVRASPNRTPAHDHRPLNQGAHVSHPHAPLAIEGRRRPIARCVDRPLAHVGEGVSPGPAPRNGPPTAMGDTVRWACTIDHRRRTDRRQASAATVISQIDHLRRTRKSARRIAQELSENSAINSVCTVSGYRLALRLNRRRFLDPVGEGNREPAVSTRAGPGAGNQRICETDGNRAGAVSAVARSREG